MAKFTIEDSANYAAQVVLIPEPFSLPNADRLVGLGIFGYTVIVSKDWVGREGQLAVFFPAEAQLADKLVSGANLYRHSEKNADPEESGYLEDNRRVRAIKLRGSVSNGLLLPVEEVASIYGVKVAALEEGTRFDHIDGAEVCRKYRVKEPVVRESKEARKVRASFKRVDNELFPMHVETDQWLRNEHLVDDGEMLFVTQKLHGTSWRGGRVPVRRKLRWYERLAKRLGVRVDETELATVFGSRKVVKDANNPAQDHFYGSDLWSEFGKTVEDRIPPGVIVYGELVGWSLEGEPIQQGHTYNVPKGERELYVYRVAVVAVDGSTYDLPWDGVRAFCAQHGFKHVPELERCLKYHFDLDFYKETSFAESSELYRDNPVPLSKGGTGKDEGIAIRIDDGVKVPSLYKYKNDSHYLWETKLLDEGIEDTESGA